MTTEKEVDIRPRSARTTSERVITHRMSLNSRSVLDISICCQDTLRNGRRQRQLTPFAFGMISFLSTEELCQITLYMGDLVLQKSEPTSSYHTLEDYQVDTGI